MTEQQLTCLFTSKLGPAWGSGLEGGCRPNTEKAEKTNTSDKGAKAHNLSLKAERWAKKS